jgi:two-component system, OmpR family, sensor histidine kinase KdpD
VTRDFWVGTAALVAAAAVIATLRALQPFPNPAIAALLLLLIVLATATTARLRVAVAVSIVAMLAFNFFLLPPFYTFTIADPQNWVALFVFLAVAIIASQLSGRARQRELEALDRQRDLERLYAFSRSVLLSESDAMPTAIARSIADAFELPCVALYDHQSGIVSWGGAMDPPPLDDRLREVARRGMSFQDGDTLITAVRLGGAPIGSLGIVGSSLSDTVLQSVASLVAIGLERARGQTATARAEAARQSSELRAAVLDAAAHEFKTPLTSMKAAATALRLDTADTDPRAELVDIVNEDLKRMEALIGDAVQKLRIDSGDFIVRRDRHQISDIVGLALQELAPRLDGHTVNNQVPADLVVLADRPLLELALRQLLDNALKYSGPTSTIEIRASGDGTVDLAIRNSDSIIPEHEQPRVVERFYRGERARRIPGTGMGLAIVRQIAQAHGGTLTLASSQELGTEFIISIPSAESTS